MRNLVQKPNSQLLEILQDQLGVRKTLVTLGIRLKTLFCWAELRQATSYDPYTASAGFVSKVNRGDDA